MAIKQNREGNWEVDFHSSKALKGFTRIRRTVATEREARELESEIRLSVQVYGKWPTDGYDQPLIREEKRKAKSGTLRQSAELALRFHWADTSYGETVKAIIWPVIDWFEDHRCPDLDKITSHHLDKFIESRKERGNSNGTINKYLSILSVLNRIGLERRPALCTNKLPIKYLKVALQEKWWLRPEELDDLTKWLDSRADHMFADYIRLVCFQGLRAEEVLRLVPRDIIGLDTATPKIQVPGKKTKGSQATIPLFDLAVPTVKSCLERCKKLGWQALFPITLRQAQTKWNECRVYLGAEDTKTATLKALRRTFASYATSRGMPTSTLQKVLRHETIQTTEGYLRLVGETAMDSARAFMSDAEETPKANGGLDIAAMVAAYKSTGATPEELARFIKEIVK